MSSNDLISTQLVRPLSNDRMQSSSGGEEAGGWRLIEGKAMAAYASLPL